MSTAMRAKTKFVVKIMPPNRWDRSPPTSPARKAAKPMRVLNVVADNVAKFGEIWEQIEKRFRNNYETHQTSPIDFHVLQGSGGEDIMMADTVADLYPAGTPREELVLYMLTREVDRSDRNNSIPPWSDLRPPNQYKRRRSSDEEEGVLRHVKQRRRYGSSLDELDADHPIASYEERADHEGDEGAYYIDKDNFLVPKRPMAPSFSARAQYSVHVEDSQPALRRSSAHAELKSTLRHPTPYNTVDRASHSLKMPSRRQHERLHDSHRYLSSAPRSSHWLTGDMGGSLSTAALEAHGVTRQPPTPVTPEDILSTFDPPESAQQPRVAIASIPMSPRIFVDEQVPVGSSSDAFQDDTTNDDDLLEDLDVDPESYDAVQASFAARDQLSTRASDNRRAFEMLKTSQSSARPPERRAAKVGRADFWTPQEDALLLRGLQQGWSIPLVLKRFKIDRSDSSARSRKQLLKKQSSQSAGKVARRVSHLSSSSPFPGPQSSPVRRKVDLRNARAATASGSNSAIGEMSDLASNQLGDSIQDSSIPAGIEAGEVDMNTGSLASDDEIMPTSPSLPVVAGPVPPTSSASPSETPYGIHSQSPAHHPQSRRRFLDCVEIRSTDQSAWNYLLHSPSSRQTKLNLKPDKQKRPLEPRRETTAEIDAQFSRRRPISESSRLARDVLNQSDQNFGDSADHPYEITSGDGSGSSSDSDSVGSGSNNEKSLQDANIVATSPPPSNPLGSLRRDATLMQPHNRAAGAVAALRRRAIHSARPDPYDFEAVHSTKSHQEQSPPTDPDRPILPSSPKAVDIETNSFAQSPHPFESTWQRRERRSLSGQNALIPVVNDSSSLPTHSGYFNRPESVIREDMRQLCGPGVADEEVEDAFQELLVQNRWLSAIAKGEEAETERLRQKMQQLRREDKHRPVGPRVQGREGNDEDSADENIIRNDSVASEVSLPSDEDFEDALDFVGNAEGSERYYSPASHIDESRRIEELIDGNKVERVENAWIGADSMGLTPARDDPVHENAPLRRIRSSPDGSVNDGGNELAMDTDVVLIEHPIPHHHSAEAPRGDEEVHDTDLPTASDEMHDDEFPAASKDIDNTDFPTAFAASEAEAFMDITASDTEHISDAALHDPSPPIAKGPSNENRTESTDAKPEVTRVPMLNRKMEDGGVVTNDISNGTENPGVFDPHPTDRQLAEDSSDDDENAITSKDLERLLDLSDEPTRESPRPDITEPSLNSHVMEREQTVSGRQKNISASLRRRARRKSARVDGSSAPDGPKSSPVPPSNPRKVPVAESHRSRASGGSAPSAFAQRLQPIVDARQPCLPGIEDRLPQTSDRPQEPTLKDKFKIIPVSPQQPRSASKHDLKGQVKEDPLALFKRAFGGDDGDDDDDESSESSDSD